MTVTTKMKTLLSRWRKELDWEPPLPAKQVDAVLARLPVALSADLRAVYAATNGGTLELVDVFMLDDLEDVNTRQPRLTSAHPGGVFFGSDGSDGFFLLDAKGKVLWVDRTMPRNTTPASDNLASFLEQAADRKTPWLDRPKSERKPWATGELLRQHRDRYHGTPADMDADEAGDAEQRLDVRFPSSLAGIYHTMNGLRIDAAGVTVRATTQLEAVAELICADGRPALVWFADDDQGRRYATGPSYWRDLGPDDVIAVAPGGDPQSAPSLGPLQDLLARWLGVD